MAKPKTNTEMVFGFINRDFYKFNSLAITREYSQFTRDYSRLLATTIYKRRGHKIYIP
jgi:hypothetical protein